jgi:hypothetical protein
LRSNGPSGGRLEAALPGLKSRFDSHAPRSRPAGRARSRRRGITHSNSQPGQPVTPLSWTPLAAPTGQPSAIVPGATGGTSRSALLTRSNPPTGAPGHNLQVSGEWPPGWRRPVLGTRTATLPAGVPEPARRLRAGIWPMPPEQMPAVAARTRSGTATERPFRRKSLRN